MVRKITIRPANLLANTRASTANISCQILLDEEYYIAKKRNLICILNKKVLSLTHRHILSRWSMPPFGILQKLNPHL